MAIMNNNSGWVKIYRDLLDKPIWLLSTPEQKVILITLLLMANHSENEWEFNNERCKVKPGQFITSLESIKQKAGKGVSTQNIRTALLRFEKYDFLTNKSTKQSRLITICNWDSYQAENKETNKETNTQLTNDQQTPNRRLTTNKNDKKEKNDKNINTSPEKFNFKRAMIEYGFNSDLVNEWMVVRKSKKAVNSKLAFNKFITQVEKTGIDKNKLLDFIAVEKQWKSFNAEWLNNLKSNKESNPDTERLEWLANYAAKAFEE